VNGSSVGVLDVTDVTDVEPPRAESGVTRK
jgi:hypothetical protein